MIEDRENWADQRVYIFRLTRTCEYGVRSLSSWRYWMSPNGPAMQTHSTNWRTTLATVYARPHNGYWLPDEQVFVTGADTGLALALAELGTVDR